MNWHYTLNKTLIKYDEKRYPICVGYQMISSAIQNKKAQANFSKTQHIENGVLFFPEILCDTPKKNQGINIGS